MTLNEIASWLAGHGIVLVVGTLILFGLYRLAQPLIHRLVVGLLQVQQTAIPGDAPAEELQKRAVTLEDVLNKLARALFLGSVVLLVLAVFELGELIAGLGIFLAALTLAGQAIVLDYLMGLLILVEGPYFKGDWIVVQGPGAPVEGEVEEINLRRTVLRDALGVMHSVSNGLIRLSSNLTRVYSVASVEVQIVRAADLDRALAVARRVGEDLESDPEWGPRLVPAPVNTAVVALTLDGATIRLMRRVPPAVRATASSELRRRLLEAFRAESIGTGRWDAPMPMPVGPPEASQHEPAESKGP
jgi:small conductance mechanosensitive channel